MRIAKPMTSCFTYSLGRSLYIPLTSLCNSHTLPHTRGPNFVMDAQIVATLCSVRDAENQSQRWTSWCSTILEKTGQETLPQKLKMPKARNSVSALETDTKTSKKAGLKFLPVDDILLEACQRIETGEFESIVFSGEGEPTLRMPALVRLATKFKNEYDTLPLRVTTNGLITQRDAAQMLKSSGISLVSVALMTHDPDQYDELMRPNLPNRNTARAHQLVCRFIQESIKVGMAVEATGVAREDVNQAATEKFAEDLGVEETSFRWRPYFP